MLDNIKATLGKTSVIKRRIAAEIRVMKMRPKQQ
jgi:hypothetical protein